MRKHYIIGLYKRRSVIALIACLLALFFSMYGIVFGLIRYTRNGVAPAELFRYFTVDINFITAIGAGMLAPFAVEGIRKKKFSCPEWAARLHYIGTSCISLIMFFAIFVISWTDPVMAFGEANFYLHVVCPVMVVLSFFFIESDYRYTVSDALKCMVPVLIYGTIYFIEVVALGEENGGWPDYYCFMTNAPVAVSAAAMLAITFGVALLIGRISNRLSQYRRDRLEEGLWDSEVNPVEIKIELFGLGRYMGRQEEPGSATIPLDIIGLIADKYGIDREELIKPYIKGLMDGIEVKENRPR
ncbi:MAG: hypothetical protein K6A90_05955 [Lachnospiraceae bacterium]|nr:hypothetical protein [Lachnospiraceae bacterium]